LVIKRSLQGCAIALLLCVSASTWAQTNETALLHRSWFEARTGHFNTYSCGPTQEVAKLAARLEQFRLAYALLAGTQSVASPPIVVMAFPDHESLAPFLPVYDGKPANLAAFFSRGSDENLIALSLARTGSDSRAMETVFHEYAHLLLRHNEWFWPMWLKEGMADIYSTFELSGAQGIRIGKPLDLYLRLLYRGPLLPLRDLFAVTRESPEYNERERQGVFYAESWLLVHYLMLGDNPRYRTRFGQMTPLLRAGQTPEQAVTNALKSSVAELERDFRSYFARGRFESMTLAVPGNLSRGQAMTTRPLSPVETCFRLGDQLLRIGRADGAEHWFHKAREIAPASPLCFEGLGFLAADRDQHAEAVKLLGEALQRGSSSFLAHYVYAREKFQLSARSSSSFSRVNAAQANDIRSELEKSLNLMPDFGPAHHLLGFFELVQGVQPAAAAAHLQKAVELEPENQAYPLTLAQAQMLKGDAAGARRTLEELRRPYVAPQVRKEAEALLAEIPK